jgi:hypothetical protein
VSTTGDRNCTVRYAGHDGCRKKSRNAAGTDVPGWLKRQVDQAESDTAVIGGSWEPASFIAHAHKQEKKIARLTADLQALMAACKPLLDAEDAAKAQAKRMQELAALAKTDQAEAKRQLGELDRKPRVHDVGNVCAEIRRVMRKIKPR